MTKQDAIMEKIEAYLAALDPEKRTALEHVRALIRQLAPDAEQAQIYGVPGFRLNGKPLVCYAAFKNHCGFYPMNPALLDEMQDELEGYRTGEGTIKFTPKEPLPDALITEIVRRRVSENKATQK